MTTMKTNVTIAKKGAGAYKIAIALDADEPSRFAAQELRRYVLEITGAELPVVSTDLASPPDRALALTKLENAPERLRGDRLAQSPPGSYAMRADGRRIWIIGRDGGGLVSGVYDFIETFLGIRFLEPGPQGEFLPRRSTVRVPLADIERLEEPAFAYRGIPDASSMSGPDVNVIDWMAKNRMNYYQMLPWHWDQCHESILPELTKRGMKLSIFGHCCGHFFPMGTPEAEAARKEHPERYALIDGQRVASQICYSNPDTVRILTDNVAAWVRRYPEIASLAVFANDGSAFCQCSRCEEIGLGKLLYGTNRTIAEKVHSYNPDIIVTHLNYPPGTHSPFAGISPMKNLFGLYCPYSDEAKFQRIYDYRHGNRRLLNEPGGNHRAICRNIRAWRQTHETLIGSYFSDQVMRLCSYMPYPDVVRDDLRYYRALGVQGFVDILCYLDLWWMDTLNLRVLARAMWNPDEPLEDLLPDFYRTYYGASDGPMAAFDRWLGDFMRLPLYHGFLVEDFIRVMTFGDNVKCLARDFQPELDPPARRLAKEWLDRGARLLENAERLSRNETDLIRRRVQRLRACLDNLACRYDVTYRNIVVAYWAARISEVDSADVRAHAGKQLTTAIEEAKTAHARLRESLQVWRTTLRDEPGAGRIAESFDGRDLLEKYEKNLAN